MSVLFAMKWSLIGFGVSLALGLLSMGALGAALYYVGYPIFAPFYGNLNDWTGDWVWPTVIFAGMLWSVSFLAAGFLDLRLEAHDTPMWLRVIAYIAVLWAGAVIVWAVLLWSQYQGPAVLDERTASVAECGAANSSYIERVLATTYGESPRLLDGSRCLKNDYNGDMVAMGELANDFSPKAASFTPADVVDEAPLDLVEAIYPEVFYGLSRSEIQISSNPDKELHVNVHLLRVPDGRLFVLVNEAAQQPQ